MSRDLAVHLGGRRVGTLSEARTNKLRFAYADDVVAAGPLGVPLLSARLPLRARPYTHAEISPFLEGLLPEGAARDRMEDTLGIRRGFTFDLLAAAGRDCAGAVTFTDADRDPPAHRVVPAGDPLDEATIGRLLSALPDRPLGAATDVRVSLAGQQSKLLVTRLEDGWGRPVDGTPSTHIFKPEDARLPGSARAEAFGLAIASLLGLSMIDAAVLELAGRPVLSVERFDRVRHLDGTIERLHQEDLCQALGIDTTRVPDAKYAVAGGPRFTDVAALLDRVSSDARADLRALAAAMVVQVALGNADAHGKNYALLLPSFRLAPLYDLVPTGHWRTMLTADGDVPISRQLAMPIGAATTIDDVTVNDLVAEAASWPGLRADAAADVVDEAIVRLGEVVERAARRVPGVSEQLVDEVGQRVAGLS